MRGFLQFVISVISGSLPKPRLDRSIVGKSRMDRDGERLEFGCGAVVFLGWIAVSVARRKRWL